MFEVPPAVAGVENVDLCTSVADSKQGSSSVSADHSVQKQLQRKAEGLASALTTQKQLTTGEVINVSKQDEQGNKYSLTACSVGVIEETPWARF